MILISLGVYAQIDSSSETFKIGQVDDGLNTGSGFEREAPSFLNPDKKDGFSMQEDDSNSLEPDKKQLDITNDNDNFIDNKIQGFKPKYFKDPEVSNDEGKDQYLGDFKTRSKFITVYCRDHQYVDGDRVKLVHNNVVAENNILLSGSDKAYIIDLDTGFNQIDFEALNQGSSGPNTAQFKVYDASGNMLTTNVWNLVTGAKGTLIVVRETD